MTWDRGKAATVATLSRPGPLASDNSYPGATIAPAGGRDVLPRGMAILSRFFESFSMPRADRPDRAEAAWTQLRRRTVWQDADKLDALKVAEHVIADSEDVAFGSRGYSLQALERDGFMRRERVFRATPLDAVSWRYSRTKAGDANLARLAQAALDQDAEQATPA